MSLSRTGPFCHCTCSITQKEVSFFKLWCSFPRNSVSFAIKVSEFSTSTNKSMAISALKHDRGQSDKLLVISNAESPLDMRCSKLIQKWGKKEHHLWQKRDSAGSGQKAMNLVCTISRLPNEKEAVYGALDKWIAWETEFPLIAAAKALRILRNRNRWKRIIQVAKWMLSKGQGATMATYDCLLLAFDMDGRVDEAEMLWNMILHTYNRSISKRLFSRMISLYDHHNVPDKVSFFKLCCSFPKHSVSFAIKVSEFSTSTDKVAKWMLSKGQGATMATYDCLLLAFDMDGRVDEVEMLWNMILHTYNRSISKRLFSRMISLYDHHNVPDKVIEVFADMEELVVKPDENTVGKIVRAFEVLGQEDKQRLFMMKYRSGNTYISRGKE